MTKFAMCVRTAELEEDLSNLEELDCVMVDRVQCEKDPTFLQIIPYITVVDPNTGRILRYTRGDGSDESRLHGKTSIGFGGHMDKIHAGSFFTGVAEEAMRELEEELGVQTDEGDLAQVYLRLVRGEYLAFHLKDSPDPVDHVHLALSVRVEIDPSRCVKFEQSVINDHVWLDLSELDANARRADTRLERWSQVVVANMVAGMLQTLKLDGDEISARGSMDGAD